MSYRVIVERPNGTKFCTSVDPITTRHMAAVGLLSVFHAEGMGLNIGDAKRLALRVREADLGDFVTHEESGYTFTTEEF